MVFIFKNNSHWNTWCFENCSALRAPFSWRIITKWKGDFREGGDVDKRKLNSHDTKAIATEKNCVLDFFALRVPLKNLKQCWGWSYRKWRFWKYENTFTWFMFYNYENLWCIRFFRAERALFLVKRSYKIIINQWWRRSYRKWRFRRKGRCSHGSKKWIEEKWVIY